MDAPSWSDIFTPDELASMLDVYAAKLAKEKGWYEIAGDIRMAADCIRDQKAAGASLVKQVLAGVGRSQ